MALNTDAGQARKESLQEMRRSRGYLDHKGYVDMYEDYLSEYICKDEMSVEDHSDLFETSGSLCLFLSFPDSGPAWS